MCQGGSARIHRADDTGSRETELLACGWQGIRRNSDVEWSLNRIVENHQYFAAAMLVAILCDVAVGWPRALFNLVGHPVSWIGRLISFTEQRWNSSIYAPSVRMVLGAFAASIVIFGCSAVGILLQWILPASWLGSVILGIVASPFLAARSLHTHVLDVVGPLEIGDRHGARAAVSMIVGRDPSHLDDEGITRATIESLSENTSDGVIAPLFWGLVAGLPGLVAYKAINTLDSMIGHRGERFEKFGYVAAKIDDLANIVPARITGLLISFSSQRPLRALQCMWRDARRHRSPNAGWPEAAMAGALGVRLSGPRVYGESASLEPWLNEGMPDPQAADLRIALRVFRRSVIIAAGILACTLLF